MPMGVASATDDPIHPVEVGIEWVAAAPRAALRTVTLDEIGADPAVLGAVPGGAVGRRVRRTRPRPTHREYRSRYAAA